MDIVADRIVSTIKQEVQATHDTANLYRSYFSLRQLNNNDDNNNNNNNNNNNSNNKQHSATSLQNY